MTDDLIFQSAVDLAGSIRRGELSSTDVVAAHLDRIDEVNPEVNAIVAMRSHAEIIAAAATADAAEPLGPLHGLPVAVKDLEDVAGLPTRAGSPLTPEVPAAADGLVAGRLRAAGAIIIGKTNTPEFGAGSHTFNPVYGLTRNPWNLNRSAGGSSGGAAAALASRMVPIADGSDLGGSLRNPASFCNVVGMRPSIGRVPMPAARSTHLLRLGVQGPMGRTVTDAALVLSVLGGAHPADPLSLSDDPTVFAAPLPQSTGARLAWGGDLGVSTCEPEVLDVCRAAAHRITEAGGSFTEAAPPMHDSMTVFRVLRGLKYRALAAEFPRDSWSLMKDTVVGNIEYGLTLDVDDILTAERMRADLHQTMTAFFGDYDVLALPAAQVAPFPADWEHPTEIARQEMTDYIDWMTICCAITPTGCPAISIPAGFTADGLPVGLQLVARVGHDRQLLEIAAALEAVAPHADDVPPITYR